MVRVSQFDVFANPDRDSAGAYPYLVVLQSDVIRHLNTCIVAPLIPPTAMPGFERLVPTVMIEGRKFVIDVTSLGVFPVAEIPEPVSNLESERYRLIAAIDLVFTGI